MEVKRYRTYNLDVGYELLDEHQTYVLASDYDALMEVKKRYQTYAGELDRINGVLRQDLKSFETSGNVLREQVVALQARVKELEEDLKTVCQALKEQTTFYSRSADRVAKGQRWNDAIAIVTRILGGGK